MGAYKPPKFVSFRNASKHVLSIPDLGIENLAPGASAPVIEGYAFPRRSHAGERYASVIEQLAGCPGCEERTSGRLPDGSPNHVAHCMLEPIEETDKERFSKAPSAPPAPGVRQAMPTINDFVAQGVPRGVAEMLIKAALAAAQGAPEGETAPTETPADAPRKAKAPKAD